MENLLFGLTTAVTGMIVVFAGLLILILCITLLTRISSSSDRKKSSASPQHRPVEPINPKAAVKDVSDGGSGDEIDPGIIAAITAAVACVLEQEDDQIQGFKVRRIRRVQNAPAWQRSGRDEQAYSHY